MVWPIIFISYWVAFASLGILGLKVRQVNAAGGAQRGLPPATSAIPFVPRCRPEGLDLWPSAKALNCKARREHPQSSQRKSNWATTAMWWSC